MMTSDQAVLDFIEKIEKILGSCYCDTEAIALIQTQLHNTRNEIQHRSILR